MGQHLSPIIQRTLLSLGGLRLFVSALLTFYIVSGLADTSASLNAAVYPVPVPGWTIQLLDVPKSFGGMSPHSLRLDGEGHPHIAYFDGNVSGLGYARQWGNVWVPVDPIDGEILTFTDAQGNPTVVTVPAGAVSENTTLAYTLMATVFPPSGYLSAHHAFTLDAYQQGVLLPSLTFTQPVTITVNYSDQDLMAMKEESLLLAYWNGSAWVDAAATCSPVSFYDRHPAENWLALPVCHLSQFALFGLQSQWRIYLPLLWR